MSDCSCNTPYLGWFYEHPQRWADPEFLGNFQTSVGLRHAYIQSLDGPIGNCVKDLHARWVGGREERILRGARVQSVRFDGLGLSTTDLAELRIELVSMSGAVADLRYIHPIVSSEDLSRLSDGEDVSVSSHEFQVCVHKEVARIVHFLFLEGATGKFVMRIVAMAV